jgi:rhodanese-related sulfurtransferase
MPATAKDLLSAARAAVPAATPAGAADLVAKARPMILDCGSGGRAIFAGTTLLDMGFENVRNAGSKTLVEAGRPAGGTRLTGVLPATIRFGEHWLIR